MAAAPQTTFKSFQYLQHILMRPIQLWVLCLSEVRRAVKTVTTGMTVEIAVAAVVVVGGVLLLSL